MSLLPLFFDPVDSYPRYPRRSRLLDQHFGHGLEADDLVSALAIPRDLRGLLQGHGGYIRPWRTQTAGQDTGSLVHMDKDKFQVNLDVQQFAPNEITVKVTGENTITVEGKHEEKEDEHGYISRHFVRKYVLPKGHDIQRVESKLSSDGVLSIVAPTVTHELTEHRHIPITHTGQPTKMIEMKNKSAENGDK